MAVIATSGPFTESDCSSAKIPCDAERTAPRAEPPGRMGLGLIDPASMSPLGELSLYGVEGARSTILPGCSRFRRRAGRLPRDGRSGVDQGDDQAMSEDRPGKRRTAR